VLLRVAHDGEALVFEVSDTGVGIPADRLEDIFAPFVRGDAASDEVGGVGLGLSIARLLVEAMHGEISVRSEVGVGTSFRVRVPLTVVDDDSPTTEASAPSRPGARLRVLVAEDNPVNRMVLTAMLESLGHEVRVAHDGGEVVPLARRFLPDLVLMDMRMPVLDGLEATRRLRAEPQFEAIRIVAVTANAFDEDRRACLDAGMDGFLPKPVTREQLHAVLGGASVGEPARRGVAADSRRSPPGKTGSDDVGAGGGSVTD
jgi:CheY-like chemotaxis protein